MESNTISAMDFLKDLIVNTTNTMDTFVMAHNTSDLFSATTEGDTEVAMADSGFKKIFPGDQQDYSSKSEMNYKFQHRGYIEFTWDHWMIVGILTPCMILLYLIIIVVAYHVFCHKEGDNFQLDHQSQIIETISASNLEESTPPPGYAIIIENGESLYVPPSYKMIFPSSISCSQDSYGGMPDFSCFSSRGSENEGSYNLSWNSNTAVVNINRATSVSSSSSDSQPLILSDDSSTFESPQSANFAYNNATLSQFNLEQNDHNVYEFNMENGLWKEITTARRGSQ